MFKVIIFTALWCRLAAWQWPSGLPSVGCGRLRGCWKHAENLVLMPLSSTSPMHLNSCSFLLNSLKASFIQKRSQLMSRIRDLDKSRPISTGGKGGWPGRLLPLRWKLPLRSGCSGCTATSSSSEEESELWTSCTRNMQIVHIDMCW